MKKEPELLIKTIIFEKKIVNEFTMRDLYKKAKSLFVKDDSVDDSEYIKRLMGTTARLEPMFQSYNNVLRRLLSDRQKNPDDVALAKAFFNINKRLDPTIRRLIPQIKKMSGDVSDIANIDENSAISIILNLIIAKILGREPNVRMVDDTSTGAKAEKPETTAQTGDKWPFNQESFYSSQKDGFLMPDKFTAKKFSVDGEDFVVKKDITYNGDEPEFILTRVKPEPKLDYHFSFDSYKIMNQDKKKPFIIYYFSIDKLENSGEAKFGKQEKK